ncbi:electron transfer flavoprotein subunit alpha/FixB family protein [Brucella tritici]|uniref:Electron transfer flavoprotein subunit alpha/FixB family protein n=1 Tax=Brucella tritici TaxID=94626 RepID=A0A6L3Y4P3_9HYPH|nr:electron transfer flavoprotein subunit alpha/FixB family protein [Brucella tritici]
MIRIHRMKRPALPAGLIRRIDPREFDNIPDDARVTAASLRRYPHKEKGQRLRRESRQSRTLVSGEQGPLPQRRPISVANDVPWVLAVSLSEEPWADAGLQVLGAARRLADELSGGVLLVRIGEHNTTQDAATLGVDRLIELPISADCDVVASRLLSVVSLFAAAHIVFAEAGHDADLARRLAVLLGDRPATALQVLTRDDAIMLEAGNQIEVKRSLPKILTLSADRFDPVGDVPLREARVIEMELKEEVETIRDLGSVATSQLDAPLSEARFLVSAGDGVTDWHGFHDVAIALGGTIAGSRQVCDAGHLPRHRQVGASGTIVEARCYLAFGISGAPQHLQGVQRCRHVVAVNTDLHAAMIKRADLAIIADAQAVMPALALLVGEKCHG